MTRNPSRDADSLADFVRIGAKALVILVVLEFLLLRILNRMSAAFPAWMRGPATSDIVLFGTFAYDGAFLVGLVLVVLVAYLRWPRDRLVALSAFAWVAGLVAAQAFRVQWTEAVLVAGLAAAAVLVVTAYRGATTSRGPSVQEVRIRSVPVLGSRPAFSLLLLAVTITFLAGLYLHIGDALGNLGAGPPARFEVYAAGEASAVLGAYLAPVAFWRRPTRRTLAIPAAGVLGIVAPALARPELLPLIAYWSLGFRLDLFFPLYLVAIAAFLYALANAWTMRRENRYFLYGLILLALSGRQLADLYSVQLALVSLLFLAFAWELSGATVSRDEQAAAEVPVGGAPVVGTATPPPVESSAR